MQALEVAHCVSKQFVVEIEKQFHSYRLLLYRFSEKCFGIPRKYNIMNTYLKQIRDISAKISAKFSLDAIFVEKYGPLTALISYKISGKIFMTSKIKLFHILDE